MSDLSQRLAALSPEKRALLEMQLKKMGREYNTFPLSYAQQRLWLFDQLHPGNTSYNMPMAFHMHGVLHIVALEQSLNTILERHEALRTTFAVVRGAPIQVVAPFAAMTLAPIDLTTISTKEERSAEAQRLVDYEGQHIFDLARGPLIRFILARVEPHLYILIVNMHHICSDGWSLSIFTHELAILYTAYLSELPSPLPPLALQYADYAVWQREQIQSEEQDRQLAYWRERLRDVPAILPLPTDYVRPEIPSYRGDHLSFDLSASLVEQLQILSQQENATLFMTLLALFQILLFRQSGQPDIVVGVPIANRNRAELEKMIGFFVNTLPLRIDLADDPSFRMLVGRVREAALGAYANQDIAFDRLLEELNPIRDLSHSPIFQVVFNLINTPVLENHWGDLTVEISMPEDIGSKFDMTLYIEETPHGMKLELLYSVDVFSQARMRELIAQFASLSEQAAITPDQRLSRFSLVTPAIQTLLPNPILPLSDHWEGAVHELFAKQAERIPEKLAVKDDFDTWSYRELNERSNQLAHYLRERGIVLGSVVAIFAHRNASLVWAILGIFKAGATYTILDPAYPKSRLIDYVQLTQAQGFVEIADAGALPAEIHAIFTQTGPHSAITLPGLSQARDTHFLAEYPTTTPNVPVGPDDIASITFTSGSTGRPKGILQRHGPLTHFIPWQQTTFGLNEHDRYTMLSGLSHDPLQRDIFTPLCLGATICIPAPAEIGMPGWLSQWMEREAITIANLTPAMLQLVTQRFASDQQRLLPALRCAFTVGDALKRHDVARLWAMAPNVSCINLYGSTETQRAVGFYIILRDEPKSDHHTLKGVIPLGRGVCDAQLLVLTPTHALCGVGEQGEIAIRSPHLAKGYLGNAVLTHERFISNPFTQLPEDRLYCTGDLGRYLPNGDVEYLARNDQQVQIRGFRIELGEIEAVLRDHLLVRDAAVIADDDPGGDKRVIAYIVPNQAHITQEDIAGIRKAAQIKLPMYMIPTAFIIITAIPLTPNGKLDRSALPRPDSAALSTTTIHAPSTPLEAALAQIWKVVLNIEHIGVDDNFFDLGGHSLLATQLIARIIESINTSVTLRMLFEAPTIREFAAVIDQPGTSDITSQHPDLLPFTRISRKPITAPIRDDVPQP